MWGAGTKLSAMHFKLLSSKHTGGQKCENDRVSLVLARGAISADQLISSKHICDVTIYR